MASAVLAQAAGWFTQGNSGTQRNSETGDRMGQIRTVFPDATRLMIGSSARAVGAIVIVKADECAFVLRFK
jgi:hypothetical protein